MMGCQKTWNEPGSRLGLFGGLGGSKFKVRFWRMNLGSGGLRFGIFRFILIPNGKFTHFLTFYTVRTFGLVHGSFFWEVLEVQSLVSKNKPRL